ncbi:MAG: DUF433 domain-containing protein [Fibrobacteria bacterium]
MKTSKIPTATVNLRIESDPNVLGGKPYIRDTRLSVEFLRGLMANGWTTSRILDVYQYLAEDDLKALGSVANTTTGHSAAAHGSASPSNGMPT